MDIKMAQFMEVIANVSHGQEELRALVERPREETERPVFVYENISVAQVYRGPAVNLDPHANVHQYQGFPPPPPPPPYN